MTDVLRLARNTIADEVEALQVMATRLGKDFEKAIELIQSAVGRVVVVGMGKSGIVGQKIAATMASTGTPAFFVHPGEAFHGDLGMIKPVDVAMLISNSGETEEVVRLLPFLLYQKNPVIAVTGNVNSTLARNADAVLDVWVEREACKNNLAPTSSTTATLVMGDALSVALSVAKNFQPEDFARFHPGGSLGRRLLTRVADVMQKANLPVCSAEAAFREVVHVINRSRFGLALVMAQDVLLGVISDGDVRRAFDSDHDFMLLRAKEMMNPSPKCVPEEMRFGEAEEQMRTLKINSLIVKNEAGKVCGILQIYDLGANDPSI